MSQYVEAHVEAYLLRYHVLLERERHVAARGKGEIFAHTHLRFWKTVKISPFSFARDMIPLASCVVLVNGFSTTTI